MDQNQASPDRQVSRKIPYPFAKAKGVLLMNFTPDVAEVQVRVDAAAEALAEVQRVLAVPLSVTLLQPEAFDRALAAAYAQAEGGTDLPNCVAERHGLPAHAHGEGFAGGWTCRALEARLTLSRHQQGCAWWNMIR